MLQNEHVYKQIVPLISRAVHEGCRVVAVGCTALASILCAGYPRLRAGLEGAELSYLLLLACEQDGPTQVWVQMWTVAICSLQQNIIILHLVKVILPS